MSSRVHASEDALGALGCERARTLTEPRVLVGGLGMGFTLRAALDVLAPDASVQVTELLPAVVEWNRGPLGELARRPLDDPRVRLEEADVVLTLRASPGRFDAVLLDIDNGPAALTSSSNALLYTRQGVAAAQASLRPGGVLAVWSARGDRAFERRLRGAGFSVARARVHDRWPKRGHRDTILIGQT